MYPLTNRQRKAYAAAELEDTATFSADLRGIHKDCVERCKASPSTCPFHLHSFRCLWRNLFLNRESGRWYSSNEKYKTTVAAMFANDVNLIDIRKFVAQQRRAHDKLDLTSPEDDEEPGITKAKADAAAMFEKPEISTITIVQFLQDKAAEIYGTKGDDELEYGKKLATCVLDSEKYLVRREYYTTPREGEDVSITEARNKWSQLFEQGRPWPEIRAVILKDAEDRDIENARTERIRLELTQELDNLKLGEAGHKKKQQRKKEREQASIAKFIKDNTQTCAGCEKPAVPLNTGLGPLECRGCEIMFRAGRQVHRTFFCSEECHNRFGVCSVSFTYIFRMQE